MLDIYAVNVTKKLARVKCLLDNCSKKWKVLSFSSIGLSNDYIHFKLPTDGYHSSKTQFYQHLLNSLLL